MRSEMNRDGTVGTTRRSAGRIMLQLIGLIKPLLHIMLLAIILGTAGYLCAIFLTILAGQTILRGLAAGVPGMTLPVNFAEVSGSFFLGSVSVKGIFILMAVIAVLRTILSRLNCWRSSVTKFLPHCAGFVRRSWKDAIREI